MILLYFSTLNYYNHDPRHDDSISRSLDDTHTHDYVSIVLDQSATEASAQVSISKLATCMITVLK